MKSAASMATYTLTLANPWQWMTFAGEFQTPSSLINTLALAAVLPLISFRTCQYKHGRRWILPSIVMLPWTAIFNNGPSLALTAALCLATLFPF
jgi:hypothetical protein